MTNSYESSKLLGEYLLFHYGKDHELMPWKDGPVNGLRFPDRTVTELMDRSASNQTGKALDLGCAVGASSFVLANFFDRVTGLDFSESFIEAANEIKRQGFLEYKYLEEGDTFGQGTVRCPEHSDKVSFVVGDACDLPNEWRGFDLVHAANLICRLPDPHVLFSRLPELVKVGGQLLLATPFTWLEEFTPKDKWVGNGNSAQALGEALSPHFKLEKSVDLPFVIREHRRKFQFSVSLGTRWRRVKE